MSLLLYAVIVGMTGLAAWVCWTVARGALAAFWRLALPERPTAPQEAHQGCSCGVEPVPVQVRDTRTGEPEVARWLCPVCLAEVSAPFIAPTMRLDSPPSACVHDEFVELRGGDEALRIYCCGCGLDITDLAMSRYYDSLAVGLPRR